MGTVARIRNVVVRVNAGDHLPPHFHVVHAGGDFEALVEIEGFNIREGEIPASAKDVIQWYTDNRALIVAEWNRVNPRFPTS